MNEAVQKQILVVLRNPAYGSHAAQEAIDVILTCAAFGQKVSVLFMGDGASLLLAGQQAEAIDEKSIEAQLGAFGIYDVEQLFACQDSLSKRALGKDQLAADVKVLDKAAIKALMDEQDLVLGF